MNCGLAYLSSGGKNIPGRGNSAGKMLKEKRTEGPCGEVSEKGLYFLGQGKETCGASGTEEAKGESSEL